MALPDSNNEVTARKLGATISALWTKIKSTFAPISHTHGNITNAGALQTTDVSIANDDKLVVTDASNSNKVARTSVTFDGSTTTTALTPKGTFETFLQSHQDISGKEDKSNKVTAWQSTPDDTHYPSEKLVIDTIDANGKGFVEVTTSNTYADITSILNAGKMPYIKMRTTEAGYPPTLYLIFSGKVSNPGGSYYYFNSTVYGTAQYIINIKSPSTWSTIAQTSLQNASYKVNTWSSTVSHNNYPSEKLVKDSIDAIVNVAIFTGSTASPSSSATYPNATDVLAAISDGKHVVIKMTSYQGNTSWYQYVGKDAGYTHYFYSINTNVALVTRLTLNGGNNTWSSSTDQKLSLFATSVAPTYSSASTYEIGDRVTYNGTLYRCNTAITTAESWTSAHWTATNVDTELGTVIETLNLSDYFSYDSNTQTWSCIAVPPLIDLIVTQGKTVYLKDNADIYSLIAYNQHTSAGYLFAFGYEAIVTSMDTATHRYEYHIYIPVSSPTTSDVTIIPLDTVTSRSGHGHGNLAADGTDGLSTHDTTKFLRGDGSWEVPTEKFVATLTATTQNNTTTISCDESILDIAEAYYANKDVWIQYTESDIEFRFKVNYAGDLGEEPTAHVHAYAVVAVLTTGDQTFLLTGKNYDSSGIISDTWTIDTTDSNAHRHGTTITGITSTGTMPGTVDSTKVLRGDGTWDAIHMHTINVSSGKFIRIRIPANTTVGHSSILFMRAYNKNSAYFCVNFAKYADNTAFSQAPSINVLLSNNHGNPDYIPQPGTNSSGDYRSCYTVNTNGDAYIFLYCSTSYIGNYIINSNENTNLISVDIVSNTSSADSTLTPTLQGPAKC